MVLGFVVLRTLNGYGDPSPRFDDGSPELLAMSFLNVTEYPPSLLFVLMTLGPALVAVPRSARARGPLADVFVTFGRVPFLFYVTHLYLVHTLAVAAGVAQGFPASAIRTVSAGSCRRVTASACRWSTPSGWGWSRCCIRSAAATRR